MVSPPDYQLAKQYQIGDRRITYFSYSDEFIVERVDYNNAQPKQLFPKYQEDKLLRLLIDMLIHIF
ncbi:hypothetical protein FJR38_24390 [Anabaena sp. UHCC 0253]|uniref:hypothetical protein n=1 Tax=Anabaena sp. UHCC 0253 TaxID=2590019 RepID=UPI001447F84B|nr:hypothetical protein [Anabaena sp. UHCC 0253]MTJ55581.1 hypothetical protein [Anabaena sp. UHCC 0253]